MGTGGLHEHYPAGIDVIEDRRRGRVNLPTILSDAGPVTLRRTAQLDVCFCNFAEHRSSIDGWPHESTLDARVRWRRHMTNADCFVLTRCLRNSLGDN